MKKNFIKIIEALADGNRIIEKGASRHFEGDRYMNIEVNGVPITCEWNVNDTAFTLSYENIEDKKKNSVLVYIRLGDIIDGQFPEYILGELGTCFKLEQKFVLF